MSLKMNRFPTNNVRYDFFLQFYASLAMIQNRHIAHQSSASVSRNPFANGLLAIFNWVIWKLYN